MRLEPLNRIKTKNIALDNFNNFFYNYIEKAIDRRKIKFESTQIDEKSNEWSNFTHCQFWRKNFWICFTSFSLHAAFKIMQNPLEVFVIIKSSIIPPSLFNKKEYLE